MTRGQVGSLRLTCTTFSFATSRRFIPAHSNLGPNAAELGPRPCTMTQNKARRTNQIIFFGLPWAQEVSGSNPDAPTTNTEVVEVLPAQYFHFRRTWEHLGTIGLRVGSQHLSGRSHWRACRPPKSSRYVNVKVVLVRPISTEALSCQNLNGLPRENLSP
jgi:hypothetical protein